VFFNIQTLYQEVSISYCVMYKVPISGGKHLVLYLEHHHSIRTQASHTFFDTKEVGALCCAMYRNCIRRYLSCCVMDTVTIPVGKHTVILSGSLYLMLCCVQTLYQKVCISCCIWYTVTTPGSMHFVLFDTQTQYQEVSTLCCLIYRHYIRR
jgi:hypothetical protein